MNEDKASEMVAQFPQNAEPVRQARSVPETTTVEPLMPPRQDKDIEIPKASNDVAASVATDARHQADVTAQKNLATQSGK